MMDTSLRTCRICKCWDVEPCVDLAMGLTCEWIALDLCSFCAGDVGRELAAASFRVDGGQMFDDPATLPKVGPGQLF